MLDPQTLTDADAESQVLGAAMIEPAVADSCLPGLPAEAFGRQVDRAIWSAIGELRRDGATCDPLTVAQRLQARDVWRYVEEIGGITYLSDLMNCVAALSAAEQHAATVRGCYARRQAKRAIAKAQERCVDPGSDLGDILAALRGAEAVMAEAAAAGDRVSTLASLMVDAYQGLASVADGETGPGIPTGLDRLDGHLGGGLHRGELSILGGRPSVGKSSLAQQIAQYASSQGLRVFFASAEMPAISVGQRGLAAAAGVDSRKFRSPKAIDAGEWERLARAIGVDNGASGLLVDDRVRTMADVEARARQLHAREPLSLVVVDHLHHLRPESRRDENRNQAIGRMVATAKEIAMQLGVAVLALSQLNRDVARGEGRKPRLSDLRESGEIEQLADVVLLLHRDGDADPPSVVDLDLIVAKNRQGEIGELVVRHERPTGRWRDVAPTIRRAGRGGVGAHAG